MTDKPIIFSAPMVRALLDGRKTQTRRLLKEQRHVATPALIGGRWQWHGHSGAVLGDVRVPYAPGDRLYVREAWRVRVSHDGVKGAELPDTAQRPIWFEADRDGQEFCKRTDFGRLRQGRFMPRWASRITLTVTEVRVQRLQEIKFQDVLAEGIEATDIHARRKLRCVEDGIDCGSVCRDSFRELWNSLHGPDAWDANPWVVAVSFTVEQRNIEA
jgi:hypothetical protein